MTDDPTRPRRPAPPTLARLSGHRAHDVAVVLGSGWRPAADALGTADAEIALADLGGFAAPTVPATSRWCGRCRSAPLRVLVFLGRTHLYEGHDRSARWCTAVRTAVRGGLPGGRADQRLGRHPRRAAAVGQPVLISDQLNLTARSPLAGPPPPEGYPPVHRPVRPVRGAAAGARPGGRPDPGRGRLRRPARPALRDPGRDPDAADLRRRPGRHVHRAGGDRGPAPGRRGARASRWSPTSAAGLAGEPLDHAEVLAAGQAAAARMGALLARILPQLAAAGPPGRTAQA